MLYEKTLSRRIIGELAVSDKSTPNGDHLSDAVPGSDMPLKVSEVRPKKGHGPIRAIGRFLNFKFWPSPANKQPQQPASIGKIYNLMR